MTRTHTNLIAPMMVFAGWLTAFGWMLQRG